MKKRYLLGSLLTLCALSITGCSCSKDGTYTFAYIEYAENGETVQEDCTNPQGEKANIYCPVIKAAQFDTYAITLNKKQITIKVGEGEGISGTGEYRIVDGFIETKGENDSKYKKSDFKYDKNTIFIDYDEATIVFKK